MDTTRWTIAFVLLLIVALGAVVYLRPGAAATGQMPQDSARPLKTFYSEKYGIAFNYPSNYKVQEHDATGEGVPHHAIVLADEAALATVPAASEGPPSITIDIFDNPQNQTLEKWIKGNSFSNYKLSPDGKLSTTAVAGEEALAYGWDGLYQSASIVFAYKKRVDMLSVGYNAPTDHIYKDFASIVSSIQLDP